MATVLAMKVTQTRFDDQMLAQNTFDGNQDVAVVSLTYFGYFWIEQLCAYCRSQALNGMRPIYSRGIRAHSLMGPL